MITKKNLFFENLDIPNTNVNDIKDLIDILYDSKESLKMTTTTTEDWIDIINDGNEFKTKKVKYNKIKEYLGLKVKTDLLESKYNEKLTTDIKKIKKEKIEIDDLIDNDDYKLLNVLFKTQAITKSKIEQIITSTKTKDSEIKKEIEKSKIKVLFEKFILMLALVERYTKKYDLCLLRIKIDDLKLRKRIFKYIIGYYISLEKVFIENTKEIANIFNKKEYYKELYEREEKKIIPDLGRNKINIRNEINPKIQRRNNMGDNLTKAIDLVKNEMMKHPRGSDQRNKLMEYYKKIKSE